MSHPTREEWMSYLYDELTAEEHSSLTAHLAVCPNCQTRVNDWRVARRNLDAWKLPAASGHVTHTRPLARWAAAAALILGIGFGVGRFATPATADAGKLRAEIRQQLRQEFAQLLRDELDKAATATLAASSEQTKRWVADYAQTLEAKRTEDRQAFYEALNKLESQQLDDFLSLKKDVDILAFNTDAGLRRARQELVQLADYSQPANGSNSPQK